MIEGTSCPHRRPNDDPHPYRPCQRVEYPKESFRLVARTVLVDRYVDVVVAKDGGDAEECGEYVGYDVEGIVQVDGEEVFMISCLKVRSSS